MEKTKKYVATAIRWFDKINGNTYHSVRIQRLEDGSILKCEFTYGYERAYEQTALSAMLKAGWLPKKYNNDNLYLFERENGYPIDWNVTDGKKRDCIANGK